MFLSARNIGAHIGLWSSDSTMISTTDWIPPLEPSNVYFLSILGRQRAGWIMGNIPKAPISPLKHFNCETFSMFHKTWVVLELMQIVPLWLRTMSEKYESKSHEPFEANWLLGSPWWYDDYQDVIRHAHIWHIRSVIWMLFPTLDWYPEARFHISYVKNLPLSVLLLWQQHLWHWS